MVWTQSNSLKTYAIITNVIEKYAKKYLNSMFKLINVGCLLFIIDGTEKVT